MTNEALMLVLKDKELQFCAWSLLHPSQVRFELSGSNRWADYGQAIS